MWIEDLILVQAVENCGREWQSVVQFMKRHTEVLAKNSKIYRKADPNDKKLHERLRKRAAEILRDHDSTAR